MRRPLAVGLVTVAAAGAVTAALLLRGGAETSAPPAEAAGAALADGLVVAMRRSEARREPFDCARWPALQAPAPAGADAGATAPAAVRIEAGRRAFERTGARAAAAPARNDDGQLVVAFVADARGSTSALVALRRELARADVELVVALGGMGATSEELTAVYGALAHKAPWTVVAIPGDREPVPAFRAALAELAARGDVVLDGAEIRLLAMDGVTIATVPGVAEPRQLVAGSEGCAHHAPSLEAFGAELAQVGGTRLIASYAPPRQRGSAGSDLAAGGVHIGEPALAALLQAAAPAAFVHGLLDEAAVGPMSGAAAAGAAPVVLGTGALEGAPLLLPDGRVARASALIVTVRRGRIAWRRVGLERKPL